MPNIVKVEPTESVFTINWFLDLYCNFDCMYCPSYFHSKDKTHKTFDQLVKFWLDILSKTSKKNLKYKISFTGGEVTTNKNFLPFLQWLDTNYGDIIQSMGFTTNGSAPLRYYIKAIKIPSISYISFSTHSEFFNENKFFNTIVLLHKDVIELNKSMHVNIMNEYWNNNEILVYSKYLKNKNIPFSINEIDYSVKIRDFYIENKNNKRYNFNDQ